MSSSLPDDINALKRLLAEQEALNRALLEKLNEREREIDHLQAQLDKLRRMNFGSRSEKSLPPYRTNGSRSEPASERER
ncbi:transposase [Escherichia coli]|nr:transposase [Escherichia coli]